MNFIYAHYVSICEHKSLCITLFACVQTDGVACLLHIVIVNIHSTFSHIRSLKHFVCRCVGSLLDADLVRIEHINKKNNNVKHCGVIPEEVGS